MRGSSLPKTPKAYEDGFGNFYGRDFLVSPDTLIPRPETEMAIDAILALCGKSYLPGVAAKASKLPENPKILDVGTGSGCIGITLALELPEAQVVAVDVSKGALEIAEKNVEKFEVKNIELHESDLLSGVDGEFDVIVANLPYVDRKWDWLDLEALSYEPDGALFADDGGCELIFKLVSQTNNRTKFLILEADPSQHEKIIEFSKKYGFCHTNTRGYILEFSSQRMD